MSQRYFLTAESTYEDLRQSLNVLLQYPNALGKSVFQTALYAPRDNFRRVLLAVDTALPGYATVNAAIQPLLDSDAIEEIDEATYLAALATATGGGATFSTVTDTLTYGNFLPSGGTLDLALQGIDSALTARALAADFDQGVKTTDSPNFVSINAMSINIVGDNAAGDDFQVYGGSAYFNCPVEFSAGISGVTYSDVGAASLSHAHSAADITSGTLSASRLPSTTVTAASYGSASSVATFTVDATGRLTAAGSTSIAIAAGAVSGLATIATSGSASDLGSGTVPVGRLGSSGTASSSTFLRGDNTWATAGSSSASDLTIGTLSDSRLSTSAQAAINLSLWRFFN